MRKSIKHQVTILSLSVMLLSSLSGQVSASSNYSGLGNSWKTYTANQPTNRSVLQDKVIVIDPGHGGSDTGAIGPSQVAEKDVTLAMAQELRKLLAGSGATVVMTRTTDKDVAYIGASDKEELQARVDIANQVNADLFISIHADSFDGLAGGTTTYYFNKTGRDDNLARLVQTGLVQRIGLYDRGFLQNDFYVLRNTRMPAVLTETAFISNPLEERLLTTPSFDKNVAQGIYSGIKQYFLGQ